MHESFSLDKIKVECFTLCSEFKFVQVVVLFYLCHKVYYQYILQQDRL